MLGKCMRPRCERKSLVAEELVASICKLGISAARCYKPIWRNGPPSLLQTRCFLHGQLHAHDHVGEPEQDGGAYPAILRPPTVPNIPQHYR